jgi:hypothetical protein
MLVTYLTTLDPNTNSAFNVSNLILLAYDTLDGVQDGGMAMDAFLEAIHPDTSTERKAQIRVQLLAYCKLDTYAMVRLWQVLAGRLDMSLDFGIVSSSEAPIFVPDSLHVKINNLL